MRMDRFPLTRRDFLSTATGFAASAAIGSMLPSRLFAADPSSGTLTFPKDFWWGTQPLPIK